VQSGWEKELNMDFLFIGYIHIDGEMEIEIERGIISMKEKMADLDTYLRQTGILWLLLILVRY
jgi:hypothetical protein